jgi:hypothetical protein
VLSGGLERSEKLIVDDMNLEKPGAFGPIATQTQMGVMGTLTLEHIAETDENKDIAFIHSYPGAVNTGNLGRGWTKGSWGPWLINLVVQPLILLLGISVKESAERHLYMATSGAFGGKGPTLPGIHGTTTRGTASGGLFLVNQNCDTVTNEKNLAELRVSAQGKVWCKTMEILRPYI